MHEPIELSVVLPCLNEADTVGQCIDGIKRVFAEHDIHGEIIVADNDSTDASAATAVEYGARVVHVPERGYGNALRGGFDAAQGTYMMMMDADGSYAATDIPAFLTALRHGAQYVQGCRMRSGGGVIKPSAMPWLHRYIGNPFFTVLVRTRCRLPLHDACCGMRAMTRELSNRMSLHSTGMECAIELTLNAHRLHATIAEVPITLYPDGRRSHGSHLHIIRDGLRTLACLLSSHKKSPVDLVITAEQEA